MSKAKLRNHLLALPKERIVEIMLELYDARKEAKEYLEFYLDPNSTKELQKCKKAIKQEFFPAHGFVCRPSFAKCRKIISDFQKLNPQPTDIASLMLFYIEQGCVFTIEHGDMWEQYYTTLEVYFEKAMDFIFCNQLLSIYYERIERIIQSVSECGWGFHDSLEEIYRQYK